MLGACIGHYFPIKAVERYFNTSSKHRVRCRNRSSTFNEEILINPATGLPMVGGIAGVDAAGFPFGVGPNDVNGHHHHHHTDDDW